MGHRAFVEQLNKKGIPCILHNNHCRKTCDVNSIILDYTCNF